MTAVEDQVGVVARAVLGAQLQEGAQLGLQGLQRHAAGGVVAAKRAHHVVGEEALHVVEHGGGAQVELLHLVGRQQRGLAVGAAGEKSEIISPHIQQEHVTNKVLEYKYRRRRGGGGGWGVQEVL